MTAEGLIVGIGIVAFLILYFAQTLTKKEHIHMRLLSIFFFMFILFLIPKATMDYTDNCKVAINTTEEVNTTYTIYTYEYFCDSNTYSTPLIFYRAVIGFISMFVLWIMIYYLHKVFEWIKNIVNKGGGRWGKRG